MRCANCRVVVRQSARTCPRCKATLARQPPPGDLRALVCDDSATARRIISRVLERCGCRLVDEAATAEEALKLAAKDQPWIVVLDLNLGEGTSGQEALPELRAVAPDSAVIVFSGATSEQTRQEVVPAGASVFLEKTGMTGMEELEEAVRGLISTYLAD